ncbi:MAG: hypothetical protein ACI9N1_002299 [Flavobacteriales bacterium]|jgi:hypothetical protein
MPSQFNIAKLNTSTNLLLLILLVASVLRCWNIFDIPYTHDEMSALLRTRFDSLGELIELGVKTDTHPPGVQVFMYYWISVFGEQNWIVKLPFIAMGVGAIYYSYKLATFWFNETTALVSSSFLAVLQFTVMYSQIARPYISGLFLIMAFTYYASKLLESKTLHKKNLIYTILFGALSAYNHHFSLLLIGLIGVGFLIISPYRKSMLIAGGGIFILYIPNIGIFINQLSRGGVGEWLGPPTWDFGWLFLKYAFHYSYLVLGLILILIATPFLLKKKNTEFSKKWFWFSLLITLAYFCIGFFYSIYKNPIIQFSMLLYVFPFILFALFSAMPKLENKHNFITVLTVLIVGTSSLIFERNHYYTFYHTRYFQMIEDMQETSGGKTDFILTNIPEFIEFHKEHTSMVDIAEYDLFDKDTSSIIHFQQLLDHCKQDKLMLGLLEQTPKEILTLSLEKYPFVIKKAEYHGAATYWLSKIGNENQMLSYYSQNVNFQTKDQLTQIINNIDSLWDNTNKLYDCINQEFGFGVELELRNLIKHPYDLVSVTSTIKLDNLNEEVFLVMEYWTNDTQIAWQASSSLKNQIDNNGYCLLSSVIDRNLVKAAMKQKLKVKSFIWNPSKGSVQVVDLNLHLIEGNRNKYSLYDPINWL